MHTLKFDYLVMGANGQDGFFTTRYLLKNNFTVLAVTRRKFHLLNNLKKIYKKKLILITIKKYNYTNYKSIFNKKKINKVIFCAGFSKIPKNKKEEKLCYEANFEIFNLFLKFIETLKYKIKILYISSSEIFGSEQKHKRNENSKLYYSNYYGYCKQLTSNLINFYRKKNSFKISTVIAYNHESFLSPNSHIIKTFIKKFYTAKNKNITIYNSNEFRNISHVYDFVPLFKKILDLNYCDDFIFANDKNYKIIDIAQMINKLIYSNKFNIISKNISTPKTSRKANNQKIKNIFNFKPKYDLKRILIRFNSYEKKLNLNNEN